jgi:hypothetical protein
MKKMSAIKILTPIALIIAICIGTSLFLEQKACLSDLRSANPNWTIHSEGQLLVEENDIFYFVTKRDGKCTIGGIAKWK